MSIVPQDPDSKPAPPNSLCGVGRRMSESADPFTAEVGRLIEHLGEQHEPPVTCEDCRDELRDRSYPCLTQENASAVAFAWLLRVIDERS